MTKDYSISQADLKCTNCAGQCVFEPYVGGLICLSCRSEHSITLDEDSDPTVEYYYDPEAPQIEQPVFMDDRPYQCESCGGEVVFQGHSISENCPYCRGVLVEQPKSESYEALGIIPFSLIEIQAQINALNWVKNRWAAPSNLLSIVSDSWVSGIYVPFWTFDSKEHVDYTVTYQYQVGKHTRTSSVFGFMTTEFDDLLMPASHHVTPLIRDGILHEFRPSNLRPFSPAYLAGFAAERHHQTVCEGLELNAADKDLLLRNRIKKHSGKSQIINVEYRTDTTGIKYRRILLPVWILHYKYNKKPMKVVVCGLYGRTFGERPFSIYKLLSLSAAVASAVTAFGFYWGAMNFP